MTHLCIKLLMALGVFLTVCSRISAVQINETLIVPSGKVYMVSVCGISGPSLTGALCSQSQMYYSIQSNISINIYWMNSTEVRNTSVTGRLGSPYSCLNSQSCVQGWFTASDPDKSLVFANPGSTATIITINAEIQDLASETLQTNVTIEDSTSGSQVNTIGPDGYVYYYLCGTTVPSGSGRSCSQTEIYYSVEASETANVYLMDLSDFQLYQKTKVFRYYSAYSAKNIYALSLGWFTASDPDKVLLITNPNLVTPTVVITQVRTRATTSSALAWWIILIIVVSLVIAMVCGAVGLAFRCGWWCWRGVIQQPKNQASQEKYGNLEGRGVRPVDIQMLPVTPGAENRRSSVSVV